MNSAPNPIVYVPSLPQRVYERLKERLMDGEFGAGERLVIDRVASELGVSQTPVREALARLEADRLVVKFMNRGYTTAPPIDSEHLRRLYEMRLILEPPAAELALTRANSRLIAELETANDRLRAAPAGGTYREFRQVAESDAAFHEAIARASGNDYLIEAVSRLRPHQQTARIYTLRGVPDIPEAVHEHRVIIDAMRARDSAAVHASMRQHLQQARSRLLSALDPRATTAIRAA